MSTTSNDTITRHVALPPARPAPSPPSPAVQRHPPYDVLVVASPDGFIEVYGKPNARIHIAERLAVDPADEVLAESYLTATLPRWARHLYHSGFRRDDATGELQPCGDQAGCLRAAAAIRPRTVAEEIDRRERVAALRAVEAARKT